MKKSILFIFFMLNLVLLNGCMKNNKPDQTNILPKTTIDVVNQQTNLTGDAIVITGNVDKLTGSSDSFSGDIQTMSGDQQIFTGNIDKDPGSNKDTIKTSNVSSSGLSDTNLIVSKNFRVDNNIFEDKKVYNPKKELKYKFNWKMNKPNIEDLNNWKYILSGYYEPWKLTYTFTKNDLGNEYCDQYGGVSFYETETYHVVKSVMSDQIVLGKTIELTGTYHGKGFCNKKGYFRDESNQSTQWCYNYKLLDLENNIDFIKKHGWLIIDPLWKFTNYEGDGTDTKYKYEFFEERINYIAAIGGEKRTITRYPYNTVYVTSDLLLHTYHVLFDQNLKYHEEAVLRKTMSTISNTMYDNFLKLYNNETDVKLKKHYGFLLSYWIITKSLFIEEDQLMGGEYEVEFVSDEVMFSVMKTKLEKLIVDLPKEYQTSIKEEFTKILNAEKGRVNDPLLTLFYPEIYEKIDVKQDFSQFKPRSHYTTDPLLKTYFMGMKWLMREKFYFINKDLASAALINVNNIDETTMTEFKSIFEFIKKLIGDDDDVNIYDLSNFISVKGWQTDQDILTSMTDEIHSELMKLKKQNIISTSYNTSTLGELTEDEAHDKTAGFVFFGEKTTIDSWIYDQLSAGSSEVEFITKPSAVTALSVPAIISENKIASKLVNIWLESAKDKGLVVMDTQVQGYKDNSQILKNDIKYFDFTRNIYHKWIDLLNYLFVRTDINDPYFIHDNLYKLKNILTYMGSYTELKHDTLLYVKQASAELGAGGGECSIDITPPDLPVPKGYIEPNIELIDELIKLTKDTNLFFNEEKFKEFEEYLQFIKALAIAQTKNEKISDEDFEKLRLYYLKLFDITVPKKYAGLPLQKEERGSIIADIFTSGDSGPLYEAVGRPHLILVSIDDINGSRIVMGPIYTHYEFFDVESQITSESRLTDENWQNNYDILTGINNSMGLENKYLLEQINKGK